MPIHYIINYQINAKNVYEIDASTKFVAFTDPNELPYFYKPIFFPEDLVPLANIVIVFSLYSSDERSFLSQLAQILGATVEESYCRNSKPLLICPEARSAKYEAAIRWSKTLIAQLIAINSIKLRLFLSIVFFILK